MKHALRQPIRRAIRRDILRWSPVEYFRYGAAGALYDPLEAYQDTGAVTPADAPAEPIGRIDSQLTGSTAFSDDGIAGADWTDTPNTFRTGDKLIAGAVDGVHQCFNTVGFAALSNCLTFTIM
jgi:hypothetical protein